MTNIRIAIALLAVAVATPDARAEGTLCDIVNLSGGPVLGVAFGGGSSGGTVVVGLEGGVGCGPERLNLGFEHRAGKGFGYIELDPWLFAGGSLGLGVDTDGAIQPVIGVWEGMPVTHVGCGKSWTPVATFSAGYRYTGVHEVYVTLKTGTFVDEPVCD